jgi:alpha-D-ribose 1-methylphosphonate 5-triphosphate synthase subunit PhnI
MYVAVKGGERAIDNAHAYLAEARRGDPAIPDLSIAQIREQMALAVDRVMAEGSLYDPDLAALALKQARGDMIEAIFLIRAYRTTLPRFGASNPIDTGAMAAIRRVSATFKDVPGGQVLGPTFDYTHRCSISRWRQTGSPLSRPKQPPLARCPAYPVASGPRGADTGRACRRRRGARPDARAA